jgi:hypothetical protein
MVSWHEHYVFTVTRGKGARKGDGENRRWGDVVAFDKKTLEGREVPSSVSSRENNSSD